MVLTFCSAPGLAPPFSLLYSFLASVRLAGPWPFLVPPGRSVLGISVCKWRCLPLVTAFDRPGFHLLFFLTSALPVPSGSCDLDTSAFDLPFALHFALLSISGLRPLGSSGPCNFMWHFWAHLPPLASQKKKCVCVVLLFWLVGVFTAAEKEQHTEKVLN